MALTGKSIEEKIYNFLYGRIKNAFGVSGLMGNLFAESGLVPTNLQNSFEKKLGYTDDTYTTSVDNGDYTNFVHDSAGYGLAQWTYWSRKENLLLFVRSINPVSYTHLDVYKRQILVQRATMQEPVKQR